MTILKEEFFWRRLWQAWLKFGHGLGNVMSWVWMPIFYYVIAMPFALGTKMFSDPLRLRIRPQKSYWTAKKLLKMDIRWAKSQGSTTTELEVKN